MPHFRKQLIVFSGFLFPVFLSGCNAKPECDSFETRNAVLKTVSDDHSNALAEYAAKHSTAAKSGDAGAEAEKSKQQPLYQLGEKIVTTSTSENIGTGQDCRGTDDLLRLAGWNVVVVGDTKFSLQPSDLDELDRLMKAWAFPHPFYELRNHVFQPIFS